MRTLLVLAVLTGGFCGALRADFGYDVTIKLTGGSLFQVLEATGPLAHGAKKPFVSTHLIKGNRMATLTKDHATIVNLDNETIFEIDFAKKTYSSMTFAQKKLILDEAMKTGIASINPTGSATAPAFQVSSQSGRTKTIGFLSARELIVTMKVEGAGAASEPGVSPDSGSRPQLVTRILLDSWILTVPGFGEVENFHRQLGAKLGYAYASGMFDIGIVRPELLPGFEEIGKVIPDADDMAAEATIRMGGPGSGDLAPNDSASTSQKGIVSGALSRIGSLAHKKNNGRQSAPSDDEPSTPGLLLEMTTEVSNLAGGAADESKFNVPAGFKEVPAPKNGH
jgi:hypothetical protein